MASSDFGACQINFRNQAVASCANNRIVETDKIVKLGLLLLSLHSTLNRILTNYDCGDGELCFMTSLRKLQVSAISIFSIHRI